MFNFLAKSVLLFCFSFLKPNLLLYFSDLFLAPSWFKKKKKLTFVRNHIVFNRPLNPSVVKQTHSSKTSFYGFLDLEFILIGFVFIFHGITERSFQCVSLVCEFSFLSSLCVPSRVKEFLKSHLISLNTEIHKLQIPSGHKLAIHRNEASWV